MNCKFTDIAGYAQEKEELKRLCDIINDRELYLQRGAKLPKGIIFYGETGTGKTLFAKVMASTCKLKMINIDLGDLADKNSLLKRINNAFESARKSAEPSMIFFDEMDKVLPNVREDYYSDHSKAILAQLLTLIDGMNHNKTSFCGDVQRLREPAVSTCASRQNRQENTYRFPRLPVTRGNTQIIRGKTTCRFEMSMEELAKMCNGFSCAALETLINECVLKSDEKVLCRRN